MLLSYSILSHLMLLLSLLFSLYNCRNRQRRETRGPPLDGAVEPIGLACSSNVRYTVEGTRGPYRSVQENAGRTAVRKCGTVLCLGNYKVVPLGTAVSDERERSAFYFYWS